MPLMIKWLMRDKRSCHRHLLVFLHNCIIQKIMGSNLASVQLFAKHLTYCIQHTCNYQYMVSLGSLCLLYDSRHDQEYDLTLSLSCFSVWAHSRSLVHCTSLGSSVSARSVPNFCSIWAVVFTVTAKFSMAWQRDNYYFWAHWAVIWLSI